MIMGLAMMRGMEYWQITMLQDQQGEEVEQWRWSVRPPISKRSSDAAIDMNAVTELLLSFGSWLGGSNYALVKSSVMKYAFCI
jgi:hypothetical protein